MLQKYAESGDSLEVSFNKEDGTILYAEYFNEASFRNALYYNYGTYWDFREDELDNTYTGYYYYKPGDTKGGITMIMVTAKKLDITVFPEEKRR